ncbi:hypothetical protein, partial [Paracoccus hibiscisoli]|uniref:hypothetical protein n=1 Tax=Paracoccus hibiscisoli TaxID=2023261 RepID=UPI001B7FDD07
ALGRQNCYASASAEVHLSVNLGSVRPQVDANHRHQAAHGHNAALRQRGESDIENILSVALETDGSMRVIPH